MRRIRLPLRPHFGCDPFCDQCSAVFERYGKIAQQIADEELLLLWAQVQERFQGYGAINGNDPIYEVRECVAAVIQDWLFDRRHALCSGKLPTVRLRKKHVPGDISNQEMDRAGAGTLDWWLWDNRRAVP